MNSFKIKSRFYFISPLGIGDIISLLPEQVHHIAIVLRAKKSDYISLFNEIDGEFVAEIQVLSKNSATVRLLELIKKPQEKSYNIHLAYAPLKKIATDFLLEKTTELGVNELTQVITANTTNKPLSVDKLTTKLTQSSQQCKRLDIPKVNPTIALSEISKIANNFPVFWLNEFRLGQPLSLCLKNIDKTTVKNITFLIGPEGGFSEKESYLLSSSQNITPVFFNGNILRAETASMVAILQYLLLLGDF